VVLSTRRKLNFYGRNSDSLHQVNKTIYIHLCFSYRHYVNYSRRETLKFALFSAYYTYTSGKESSRELNALFRTCIVLIHGSFASYAPKENNFFFGFHFTGRVWVTYFSSYSHVLRFSALLVRIFKTGLWKI